MDGPEEKFENKVHVILGADAVLDMLINTMDKSEETIDIYSDFRGPNITDATEAISHYIAAQKSN